MDNSTERWALILGASSGFGAATSLSLARNGFNIVGVHLDRRATLANAEKAAGAVIAAGRKAIFFNINAADQDRRGEVLQKCAEIVSGEHESTGISLVLHSLAFGTLKPYISHNREERIKPADMNMTLDVMAHSLVYWTQDLFYEGLLKSGSKVFAMTSAGSHRIWPSYGAVSAAKAALESHVRQLAVELGPFGIAVNAIQAGVTDTPAARRIPGNERMFEHAKASNPRKRLTTPEDAAEFIAALALLDASWTTGNVIRVDGGEDLV